LTPELLLSHLTPVLLPSSAFVADTLPPSNQPVFFLIVGLSVMKIIEDSFINLILPLFQAQMLNSLICRRDISQTFFQQSKVDNNPFPSQEKFEDALNSNSTFCSACPGHAP
jgi:hypothetical protein